MHSQNHSQGRPQHTITHFMQQAHKQLSQAAQLSLETPAHQTFNITLACSALYCSTANIDGFGATQSIRQMSKTTWILTVPLEAEDYTILPTSFLFIIVNTQNVVTVRL